MFLRVLVRWFLGVSFAAHLLQIIGICEAGALSAGAQGCHLASLVPPFGSLGAILPHLGSIVGGHGTIRTNTLRSGVGFVSIWAGFWDRMLKCFLALRTEPGVVFRVLPGYFLKDSRWSKSGCLGLKKRALAKRNVQFFSQILGFL